MIYKILIEYILKDFFSSILWVSQLPFENKTGKLLTFKNIKASDGHLIAWESILFSSSHALKKICFQILEFAFSPALVGADQSLSLFSFWVLNCYFSRVTENFFAPHLGGEKIRWFVSPKELMQKNGPFEKTAASLSIRQWYHNTMNTF